VIRREPTRIAMPRFLRCLLPAVLAMALVWAWMALTVRYSYHGNWTGLFCSGDRLPPTPALAHEHILLFPNSVGYDGQAYHYMAHDPFFQKGFAPFLDMPRVRYRRPLLSLLAWTASAGNDARIDASLIGVVIAFCGLGVYWLARVAVLFGFSNWIGLLFLLAPSVLVSIDRILTDGALAAFCVGFFLYWRERNYRALWWICLLAALTRETGAALAGAMALYFVFRAFRTRASNADSDSRLPRTRALGLALLFTLSLLPALGWDWYAASHTAPEHFDWLGPIPFAGFASRLVHPLRYALPPWIERTCIALDYAGLAGILIALWRVMQKVSASLADPPAFVLYLFALLTVFLWSPDAWAEVYAFGRTLAPLLIFVALDGFESPPLRAMTPGLLSVPRIGVQWGSQLLSVARGLTGW